MVHRWRRKGCFYYYISLSKASQTLETPLITVHHYSLYDNSMLYDNSRVRIIFERGFYSVVFRGCRRESISTIK